MTLRRLAISPGDGRDLRPWIDALPDWTFLIREPTVDATELVQWLDHAPRRVWLHERTPDARAVALQRGTPLHLTAQGPAPASGSWGRSCHDAASLHQAFADGARWATLSPVWAPTSKPTDRRRTLGAETFLALAGGRPVYALGGVDPARAARLQRRGAHGIAVLGGIFDHPDPLAAARAWTVAAP